MIINHNMNAMSAHRQMGINTGNQGKSIEKLSSGQRINRAGDDAAGLAISEKMRGQIRGLEQGSSNAQDGISMIQTAEGAANESQAILQRMRELSVQSANGTNTDDDRGQINKEFTQLKSEIDRIASQTQFNKQDLLSGDKTVNFQVGANEGQQISVDLKDMSASALGLSGAKEISVDTATNAQAAITALDSAIENVSGFRSDLGSVQNRLEHTIAQTDNSAENLQSAESRIRDVDMAKEMMNLSKNNVLVQAAQSMLGQANQQPNQVLSLLR
ncbi:flagellin [uncultured Clostridium sp.]|jgi:flagellin|uniref:flagellin N-terminal helical domain-containing protein n=1 Tax=uncultured Clostridium sp. TaxID=59620 RepID=UPI002630EC43|nr:flagellin [uncultured Clostridium sp.]